MDKWPRRRLADEQSDLQTERDARRWPILDVHNVKQQDLKRDCHPALVYSWRMIFSENRFPLFGIMRIRSNPITRASDRGHAGASTSTKLTRQRGTRRLSHAASGGRNDARVDAKPGVARDSAGPLALLPVGGGLFARRRVNPVVVTLVWVDRSPIGRPCAHDATCSVG
jgi:hypothetical protein